jgi:stalled ribosome rescue protein Dom34
MKLQMKEMPTMSKHVIVWIDHQEARILHVQPEGFDESKISSPNHHVHRHPKGPGAAAEHPDDAQRYFHEVVQALAETSEILIVGPGTAKLELVKYVHKHAQALVPGIVGIETVDHPTGGQIVAYGRKYFLASDRMRGLAPL